MPRSTRRLPVVSCCLGALALLAGCSSANIRDVGRDEYNTGSRRDLVPGRLTGADDGIILVGTSRNRQADAGGGAGLGVNAFLWRATLDTLAFMPLASADPFGGVIITDWYSPPGATNERFKATAYVMGRQLRSDGVRIAVFRQVRSGAGWVDAAVTPATASELEDRVLARARELRSQTASR
ncbi:DUF3576 domain-containing protein [Roseomonas alkaliterrae]|uniref:DUF3576 domain-containing protein n=1 Tax=Neoroseomonas alkaliterrae TaxID=1452450 RepID=A0A840XVZ4_9PROT|nr:DUF3576 domain-containing protein [Neoroseomonas alkaliterrae]MBB5688297.1 hypothetical protein [Neoroseomonas alkaliterrae]MBR0677741.1 DUF3576 domain-containing protein [Neoroseomonas alkaliterrae]